MHADRFTIKTQEALQAAIALAARRRHAQVAPEHLLAVLLEQADGIVVPVLGKLGVVAGPLRADVNETLDALPTLDQAAEPTTAAELLTVLRAAEQEMRDLSDEYLSTEHLLLALAASKTPAGDALRRAGATEDGLLEALADRVADAVLREFSLARRVTVTVRKPGVAIKGSILDAAGVRIHRHRDRSGM